MSAIPAASGQPISLSQITREFGVAFSNFTSLRGVDTGVPASGALNISHLYGKKAAVPTLCNAFATLSLNVGASTCNALVPAALNVKQDLGAPFTYEIVSTGNPGLSGVTVNAAGTIAFQAAAATSASSNLAMKITNRFGRSNTVMLPYQLLAYKVTASTISGMSIGYGPSTRNLASFFTDTSGQGLYYWVSGNPKGNAAVSGSTLTVNGDCRGTTYTVTVSGSNVYGQTASSTLSVTEISPSSPWWGTIPSQYLWNQTRSLSLSSYAYDSTGSPLTFSIYNNPYGTLSLSSSTLYLTGELNGQTYTSSVMVTNKYGLSAIGYIQVTQRSASSWVTRTANMYCSILGTYGMAPWGSASGFVAPSASWIWNSSTAYSDAPTDNFYIEVDWADSVPAPYWATLHIIVDNTCDVYMNGSYVGSVRSEGWNTTNYTRLSIYIQGGYNLLRLYVGNAAGNTPNPAGLLCALVRDSDGVVMLPSGSQMRYYWRY